MPPWEEIYIEAPEPEARRVFKSLFDRDPDNVTCDCCGEDYSVSESDDLEQATGYHRHCPFDGVARKWVTSPGSEPLDEYLKREDVKVVRATEIST